MNRKGGRSYPSAFLLHPSVYNARALNETRPLLIVIVPCYNGRATVAELLRRVRAVLVEKEIIVVDDQSTDGSRDVVASLANDWPEVRHFLQPVNMGKGAAIRRG